MNKIMTALCPTDYPFEKLKKIQSRANPTEADSNHLKIALSTKKINLDNKTRFG